MALALLGALAGFASGAAARVEKEREDNEELLKTRLKLAAINKKKREEELNARKQVYLNRYSSIQPYLFDGVSEEQQLALISDEAITKDFVAKRSSGMSFDINQYLLTVKDKIPKNFEGVRKTIDTISAPPTALTAEQMQGAFGGQEGAFGANVGVSAGRAERIAAGLGGGTAAELLAYENMQPIEADPLSGMARINVELFPNEPKTLDEQITQQQSVVSAVADKYGEDKPETEAAISRLETLKQRKSVLDPDQQSFATMLDRAKAAVANAKDDDQLKTAQQRLDRLIAIGKEGQGRKLPSVASLNNLLTDAAAKAVVRNHGSLIGQGIVTGTEKDAEGNTFTTYRYVGGDSAQKAKIEATVRRAMRTVAETFMNSDGSPISPDLISALAINEVTFDPKTGKFNWTYTPPASEESPGAPAASSARRIQTPPTQAAPAQTAPVRQGLGARPANIAEERRNAQAAIAKGAPADAVRKRFKEKTGQDL